MVVILMMLNNTVRGVVWVLFKCHMLHSLVVCSRQIVALVAEVGRQVWLVNFLMLFLVKRESFIMANLYFVMLYSVRGLGLDFVEQLIILAFNVVHDLLATMVVNIVLVVVTIVV